MIVVSNTSPLCYLILIEYESILPSLFDGLTIPQAVHLELEHPDAPDAVRKWIAHPPDWLEICEVSGEPDADLMQLHAGEREAIVLTQSISADLLILDEKAARAAAAARDIRYTGLLGVLSQAVTNGLVDLPSAIARLRHTTFRVSPRVLKTILDRHRANR